MKVEIVDLEDIAVIAARGVGNFDEVAADAWGRIMPFVYANGYMQEDTRRFGVTHDDPNVTDLDKIRYDACLDLDVDISEQESLKKMTIAGGKYATFLHKGSYDKLGETYNYAFNKWLPDSGCQLRMTPCFDLYLDKDPRNINPKELTTIVHLPIE